MNTTNKDGGYLRLSSVAKLLGTSRIWVYNLVKRGRFHVHEINVKGHGKTKAITVRDFVNYAKLHPRFHGMIELKLWHLARTEARLSVPEPDMNLTALAERYNTGTPLSALAKEQQCSVTAIWNKLQSTGIADKYAHRKAKQQERLNAKFSFRDKENMVKLYAEGVSIAELCRQFGGDQRLIRSILVDNGVALRSVSEAARLSTTKRWVKERKK